MNKLELWNEFKSYVKNCSTDKCDICGKHNDENMSVALGYGRDDYCIFICKKCWLGEE